MTVALGSIASTAPLTTGKISRVIGGTPDGAMVWPGNGAYFAANTSSARNMLVGPFTSAQRFFLHARAWCILQNNVGSGWQVAVMCLQLVNGSYVATADRTGRYQAMAYLSQETHGGGWKQFTIESCFDVNPGTWYVQMISAGGGGNYYCSADHLGMTGWTVGEGVY